MGQRCRRGVGAFSAGLRFSALNLSSLRSEPLAGPEPAFGSRDETSPQGRTRRPALARVAFQQCRGARAAPGVDRRRGLIRSSVRYSCSKSKQEVPDMSDQVDPGSRAP